MLTFHFAAGRLAVERWLWMRTHAQRNAISRIEKPHGSMDPRCWDKEDERVLLEEFREMGRVMGMTQMEWRIERKMVVGYRRETLKC